MPATGNVGMCGNKHKATGSGQYCGSCGHLVDADCHIRGYIAKEEALQLVSDEYDRAVKKFGAFHNAHEGWGVIREEYLELEDEIKKKQKDYSYESMRKEAKQLSAMALRFIIDIT